MLLSGLQNMSIDIAVEKGDGTLKRLAGTPLSPISFFIGKIGQVLVTGLLQAALLLWSRGSRSASTCRRTGGVGHVRLGVPARV